MPLRDLCGIGICSRLAPAANVRFARVATISTAHAAFNGAGSGVRMGRGDTRSIRFDMRNDGIFKLGEIRFLDSFCPLSKIRNIDTIDHPEHTTSTSQIERKSRGHFCKPFEGHLAADALGRDHR